MAESNVIAPIFRWANWWIADDVFTWINNSYFSSKNIEIRENARWISLSKQLTNATSTSSQIYTITKATSTLYLAFWDSGVCKKQKNWNWSNITLSWISGVIVSSAVFNDDVYFATTTKLYKASISDMNSNASVTPTEVTTLVNHWQHPMLVSMWDLYVGNGEKLWKVDLAGVYSDIFTLEKWWIITKLNDLWWAIRVTTQSALWNSNIYLWDWVAKEPDQTVPLTWYVVYQSMIYNGYPYLVTNRWLGILDWYKIYPLKKCDDFANIQNWIGVYNERLIIAWKKWIYSWWAKNKNYNEVLSYDYELTTEWAEVTAIYSDWIELFVAWKKPWSTATYGIDKLSSTNYNTQWELITRWYYANSLIEIKDWILARLWYSQLRAWETIKIYYSINGWDFTLLRTIDKDTDTVESFTEDLFVRDRFQYIQFKFELILDSLTADLTKTPSIYALDFIFNNNVQR